MMSGHPTLSWEWKALLYRSTHQQIELADYFFPYFAS